MTNQEWLERLESTLPLGSSCGSKAAQLVPQEPAVIVRADGCRAWDADGRDYVDFKNALGPVTLGYRYPAVDEAIRAQLDKGILFSAPAPLEAEVSEMLCEVIPCAEQAAFLKTGGEACAAVIRLARAYTGRDHVIQIGYNGWINTLGHGARILPSMDTVAGANLPGVPASLSDLHHIAAWNDEKAISDLFDEFHGKIAAIIVAMDYANPEAGETFYPFLRQITQKNGALLIFDEIVTGFRVALGGVQEYFGVTPDLAVFAKGIANGMPLSVYAGRKDIMKMLARGGGVVVSSTCAGDALSLAACKAVIHAYREHNVIQHMWDHGSYMWDKVNGLFGKYAYSLELKGFPCCKFFSPTADAKGGEKNAFFRACFGNGVSLYNTSYINFSHQYADLDEALGRMENALIQLTQ